MISKTTQRILCAFTFGALALNTTPAWARMNTSKKNRTKTHYSFNLEALNEETAKFSETKNNISVYAQRLRRNKRLHGVGGFEQIQLTIKNNNPRNQKLSLDNIDLKLVNMQEISNKLRAKRIFGAIGMGLLVGCVSSLALAIVGAVCCFSTAVNITYGPYRVATVATSTSLGTSIVRTAGAICLYLSPVLLLAGTPTAGILHGWSRQKEDDREMKCVFSEQLAIKTDEEENLLLFTTKKNLEKSFDLTLVDQLGNETTFNVAL